MTDLYTRYDGSQARERYDAIVIGSGIGGLGVAALLARQGRRALVLERHTVAGGLTHTFRRGPFTWDVGLHYIGKVHDEGDLRRRAFDYVSEGRLRWASTGPVYDRLVFDDAAHEFPAGEAALRDALARAFPQQRRALAQYFALLHAVERRSLLYFAERLLPRWLGDVAHPLLAGPFRRHADRSTLAVLRSLTDDARLIGVLSGQWGNYALPPADSSFAMHALMAEVYLDGANYPVGGAGALLSAIAPTIRRAGGEIAVKAEVAEIVVQGGRAVGVRLAGGDELRAPTIVSDAGVYNTFARLLPAAHRNGDYAHVPERTRPAMGHVCLYLGLRGDPRALGLDGKNLWVLPGYDHDASVREYFRDRTARFPVVYLSSSAAKDPAWPERHPGRATLTAIAPAPYAWFEPWEGSAWRRRPEAYEALKAELTERLLAVVHEHLPELRGRVEHAELSTPLSTRHFSAHHRGAMYGLEHSPERFAQRWLRPATTIPGLYLTGQDTVTVGVGASMISAVLTASAVLRKNLVFALSR